MNLNGPLTQYRGTLDDTCAFCGRVDGLSPMALRIGERQIGTVNLCDDHSGALEGHEWAISPAKVKTLAAGG